MKKYNCEYEKGHTLTKELGLPDMWWQKKIEANNPTEAYEIFLEIVGSYPLTVKIETGFLAAPKKFKSHIESAGEELKKNRELKKKTLSKPEASTEVQILDVEYQGSGWEIFLNVCGFLNLILFVIGGIWLLKARSSEQFEAMNLTIFGLVAAINCFFFAFLVNTFTRIQHNTHLTQINTHQTTLELKKLNNKNESKD
jgi:hypothetical protein